MKGELRRFMVGDPIPLSMSKRELAAGLGLTPRQVDAFRRQKNHPAIRQLDAPGHPRFDGRAVKVWLEGGEQSGRRWQKASGY